MKTILKSIFIGLGVLLLYWIWIAWFPSFFNGLAQDEALIVGTGFFLSFELVILAGVILSKMKNPS
jgi:hypothetical protein